MIVIHSSNLDSVVSEMRADLGIVGLNPSGVEEHSVTEIEERLVQAMAMGFQFTVAMIDIDDDLDIHLYSQYVCTVGDDDCLHLDLHFYDVEETGDYEEIGKIHWDDL